MCTIEQRRDLFSTAGHFHRLSIVANESGLLQLAPLVAAEVDPFTKLLFDLIVDGTDPDMVRDIAERSIVCTGLRGIELRRHLLSTESALAIQTGTPPRWVDEIAASIIGLDLRKELFDYLGDASI